MQRRPKNITYVFQANQGFLSPDDCLLACIIGYSSIYTGATASLVMIYSLLVFAGFRLVQPKGHRKPFNIFVVNWIIQAAQDDDSSKIVKLIGGRIAKVCRANGYFMVTSKIRYRA